MKAAPAKPAGPSDTRLTPGAYMRHCREHAGVSILRCAAIISAGADRPVAYRDIERLEANEPGDYSRLVRMLRDSGAFPFDYVTFIALAAGTCDPSLDPNAEI